MGRYELNNKCVPSIEHEELKNLILLRGSFRTYFPLTHCERGARVAAMRRKLTTLFRYGVVVRFLRSDVRSPRAISTKSRFRIIVKKHLKSLSREVVVSLIFVANLDSILRARYALPRF